MYVARPLSILLVPAAVFGLAAAVMAVSFQEVRLIAKTSFEEMPDPSLFNTTRLEVKSGAGMVTVADAGRYKSDVFNLEPRVTLPKPPAQYLHLSIRGFQLADVDSDSDNPCSSRLFLIPQEPGWPYGAPTAIWMMLERRPDGSGQITLYQKTESESGAGSALYHGVIADPSRALDFDIYLNRSGYLLEFDDNVQASSGARSGRWDLTEPVWDQPLAFGFRVTNHREGMHARMTLDALRVGIAEVQR